MKKVFKRVVPLLLAVVLCVCMAAPAFAASPDDNAAETTSTVYYYKVTSSNGANMRKEATTSSDLVASFAYGTYLYYISSTRDSKNVKWYKLGHYNTTGWIRSDLVEYAGYFVTA